MPAQPHLQVALLAGHYLARRTPAPPQPCHGVPWLRPLAQAPSLGMADQRRGDVVVEREYVPRVTRLADSRVDRIGKIAREQRVERPSVGGFDGEWPEGMFGKEP